MLTLSSSILLSLSLSESDTALLQLVNTESGFDGTCLCFAGLPPFLKFQTQNTLDSPEQKASYQNLSINILIFACHS